MADVLERFQSRSLGVDERLLAGEAGVPGQLLLGLDLGIALREPHLGERVLAADQLVEEFGTGIIGKKSLVAVVGLDVLLLLILDLGDVVLRLLAPVRAFSLLGDLRKRGLGLRELALLEQF